MIEKNKTLLFTVLFARMFETTVKIENTSIFQARPENHVHSGFLLLSLRSTPEYWPKYQCFIRYKNRCKIPDFCSQTQNAFKHILHNFAF